MHFTQNGTAYHNIYDKSLLTEVISSCSWMSFILTETVGTGTHAHLNFNEIWS